MNSFLKSCKEGNFVAVVAMLNDADSKSVKKLLNARDADGFNCLHWAAWHGDIEGMRYLLTMEDLDVNAKNNDRETAFDITLQPKRNADLEQTSYYPAGPTMEMLQMLFEVNNGFVNQCDNEDDSSPLQTAIEFQHFDVVKLLVELGSDVNHVNSYNESVLHVAARQGRVDCIRFLMKETRCDPFVRDDEGWPACCLYVTILLETQMPPSKEQIEFISEMLLLTFKSPVGTYEIYLLLIDCFVCRRLGFRGTADTVFNEIVKMLLPIHPRKYFVEKILEANLKSNYCLITMTMFHMREINFDNCELLPSEISDSYDELKVDFESDFLQELFELYLADEMFFREYLAKVGKCKWKFVVDIIFKFCQSLTKETPLQKVFDFVKILIEHNFNLFSLIIPQTTLLPSYVAEHISKIFVPLSNFVHVPKELVRIFGAKDENCYSIANFNESDNCIDDYHKLMERKGGHSEVVSLQNLARLSYRKYTFAKYGHFNGLKVLYSLEYPKRLKRFLCYNSADLKF